MQQSLGLTTLAGLAEGNRINVERAARDGAARDGASFGAVPSGDPTGSLDEALGTALVERELKP